MKKFSLLIFCISLTALVVLADISFVGALKTCTPFSDSGIVNTQGIQATSTKVIEGWEGNKCVYREKVSFSGMNTTTTCKFTKPQIDEIVSVMQAYELVQKYSNEKVDTSNLEAAKNNPVIKVWQKYLQDSAVCTISDLN